MRVRDVRKKLNIPSRVLAMSMAVVCAFCAVPAAKAEAAVGISASSKLPGNINALKPKKLTLKACRSLAIENSDDMDSLEDQVASKQANYESAVKAIKLKEASMKQLRWSPLLNFQLPTTPTMEQASEFEYKPIALQYEITVTQHKLQDKRFDISEKVNNLYVEIVVLQETLDFNERRLESLEEGLARNEAKLRIGQANKADVDKLTKKVDSLKSKIAADRRTLEANLKKLSKMVGFDVTTNYLFEKPFLDADIAREQLDPLILYTEDRDEAYYEACIAETTARAELTTNSKLMKKKYGGDYNMIANYVSGALNGVEINKKAFKADYKNFLKKIDSYWEGKKRILFIKIPKLWFKGSMAGTRWIEDDPYMLYQNVLDYVSAARDKKSAQEELDQAVIDSFNNYVSVRNSYKQYIKDVDEADANLKKDEVRNRNGELSFEEYNSEMESYEELQNSMLDAMKLLSTTLYSFDRQTCGGISALLSGTDADLQTAVVGESYPEKNTADGAYYTLKTIIQKMEFELRVVIPDDFPVEITDYELWVDNILVGERNPTTKKLRHLALAVDSVTSVKIRLYNGEEFVDDCVIDPQVESGPLEITTGYDIKRRDPNQIGTYEIVTNDTTGIVEISFKMDSEDIKKFKVLTREGKALGGDIQIEIDKPLKYITLIKQSLDDLEIEFYDASGGLANKARFDTANGVVLKKDEEE